MRGAAACGAAAGAEAVKPKLAVVAHLNELGHAKDRWRWTWADGAKAKKQLEAAGFAATVPLWGDRIAEVVSCTGPLLV